MSYSRALKGNRARVRRRNQRFDILFVYSSRNFLIRSSTFHAETHVPTESPATLEDAWLSHANEDPRRPGSVGAAPRQRTQTGFGEAGISRVAGTRCGGEQPFLKPSRKNQQKVEI